MTLLEKQQLFVHLLAKLIFFAEDNGYQLTLGRGRVSEEANKADHGHPKSTHLFGVGQDLNLYRNGLYLSKTEDHKLLGEFWESLHPLCCWGGRFQDGNHYSITHEGVK